MRITTKQGAGYETITRLPVGHFDRDGFVERDGITFQLFSSQRELSDGTFTRDKSFAVAIPPNSAELLVRLCQLITNSPSTTMIRGEIESLALECEYIARDLVSELEELRQKQKEEKKQC